VSCKFPNGEKQTIEQRKKVEEWEKEYGIPIDEVEPAQDFQEFASIFIPDIGDRLDLESDDAEAPEIEILEVNAIDGDTQFSKDESDYPHIEQSGSGELGTTSRVTIPKEILKIRELMGGNQGMLQRFVISLIEGNMNIDAADAESKRGLEEMHTMQNNYCKDNGIEIDTFTLSDTVIHTFTIIIRQAIEGFKLLMGDPKNIELQQSYIKLRGAASTYLNSIQMPANVLDALVPPEEIIAKDIGLNTGLPQVTTEGAAVPPESHYRAPQVTEEGDEDLPPGRRRRAP
jgi:hypothetical protein